MIEKRRKEKKDEVSIWYVLDKPIANYGDVEVSVYYSLGGYNYYTGNKKPRGYYLSMQPCNLVSLGNDMYTQESTLMGDFMRTGTLLEETTRFNAKRFKELSQYAYNTSNDKVVEILDYFYAKADAMVESEVSHV